MTKYVLLRYKDPQGNIYKLHRTGPKTYKSSSPTTMQRDSASQNVIAHPIAATSTQKELIEKYLDGNAREGWKYLEGGLRHVGNGLRNVASLCDYT